MSKAYYNESQEAYTDIRRVSMVVRIGSLAGYEVKPKEASDTSLARDDMADGNKGTAAHEDPRSTYFEVAEKLCRWGQSPCLALHRQRPDRRKQKSNDRRVLRTQKGMVTILLLV